MFVADSGVEMDTVARINPWDLCRLFENDLCLFFLRIEASFFFYSKKACQKLCFKIKVKWKSLHQAIAQAVQQGLHSLLSNRHCCSAFISFILIQLHCLLILFGGWGWGWGANYTSLICPLSFNTIFKHGDFFFLISFTLGAVYSTHDYSFNENWKRSCFLHASFWLRVKTSFFYTRLMHTKKVQ